MNATADDWTHIEQCGNSATKIEIRIGKTWVSKIFWFIRSIELFSSREQRNPPTSLRRRQSSWQVDPQSRPLHFEAREKLQPVSIVGALGGLSTTHRQGGRDHSRAREGFVPNATISRAAGFGENFR